MIEETERARAVEKKPIHADKISHEIAAIFFIIAIFSCGLYVLITEINRRDEQRRVSSQQPPINDQANNNKAADVREVEINPPSDFWQAKAELISKAIQPRDPRVRGQAVYLAGEFAGEYNIGQVCAIWYFLREKWRYVSDPRGDDYIAAASESIQSGLTGDCDDFAILMASMIEAIGGTSRIVLAYNDRGGHAYCEIFVTKNPRDMQNLATTLTLIDGFKKLAEKIFPESHQIFYRMDKSGCWLNLDWFADYPGGPSFEANNEFIIYPSGEWTKTK